ncbi:hypothetical protein K8352_01720 [Flavobacteriaceae bacterium F89]|uniref:Uncharacterized protein n=1 Tax=Cerina litoralis TaxID=2874477 RepID=A0AAE3ESB3_9FLAO|nr:hypothetical protein [Cerina litoralis]MCG2459460.1 hypothetical protein [Cerina litoralis]
MKKVLLFIIAIPIGLIASMILPNLFSKIFTIFIPFDSITNFLDIYFMKFISGWIAVGITVIIVPSHKILFGLIMLGLNLLSAYYMFISIGDEFNYLFVVGGILPLIFTFLEYSNKKTDPVHDSKFPGY